MRQRGLDPEEEEKKKEEESKFQAFGGKGTMLGGGATHVAGVEITDE